MAGIWMVVIPCAKAIYFTKRTWFQSTQGVRANGPTGSGIDKAGARLTPKLLLPTQPLATTAWMRRDGVTFFCFFHARCR